ncbi:EAL domain-containing protein [Acidihalobacter ferrooxydans]|nr:EAL domain-containing protein [Acidihalobacter ferrooxydans]
MTASPERTALRRRALSWAAALLFAIGLAAVVAYLSLSASRRVQSLAAEGILQHLASRLAIDRALLTPLSALRPVLHGYSHEQLDAVAHSLLENYPYITDFAYLARQQPQAGGARSGLRLSFIARRTVQAGNAPGESLARNRAVAQALDQALATGKMSAAQVEYSVADGSGYLVLMPVYRQGGFPADAPARRRDYVGAFMLVIDFNALFDGLLAHHPGWAVTVERLLPDAEQTPLNYHRAAHAVRVGAFSQLTFSRDLVIDHHRLHVVLARQLGLAAFNPLWVLLAFILPLALYAGFDGVLMAQRRRRVIIEEAAERRVADVRRRAEQTLRSLADGVVTTDADLRVRSMNPAACRLSGWPLEEALDQPCAQVLPLTERHTGQTLPRDAMPEGLLDAWLCSRQGERVPVEISCAPLDNADTGGIVVVVRDLRRERELAQALAYHAEHDRVSGLRNRHSFEHRLQQWFDREHDTTAQGLLCQIDINQLAVVNDSAGYRAGDELLRSIAALLERELPQNALLARLGSDEFGFLLPGSDLDAGRAVLYRLRDLLREHEFLPDGHRFHIGASIGAVEVGAGATDINALLAAADTACLLARAQGRNQLHIYTSEDDAIARHARELNWPEQLHAAMREQRIELYQQLMLPLSNDARPLMIYEFLIRLRLPDGEQVGPARFMAAAERFHLMRELDRHVIDRAFASIAKPDSSETLYTINLSGQSLDDSELCAYVLERLQAHGVRARQVCFEITETAAIANLDKARLCIDALRKRGFRFALDDFGAGLSSFAYLKRLPADFLKIEGEFVRGMLHSETDRVLVESIVSVARAFGLRTIAESVEDPQTLERLRAIGVDYAQGYHLGRPRPGRASDV